MRNLSSILCSKIGEKCRMKFRSFTSIQKNRLQTCSVRNCLRVHPVRIFLFKKRKFEKDRYSSYFQSKAYKVSQRCIRSNVSSNVLHAFTHSVMAGLRFGGTTTPTSVLVKGQKTSSCLVPKEKDPPSVLAFDHSVRLPALTVSETFQWPP